MWCLGLALLLGWLAWQWLVPSGEWQTMRVFPGSSRRVSDFYPAERVAELIDLETALSTRTILVEPAYLRVRVPRRFREVEVAVKYRNPNNIPWRMGVRETTQGWRWRLFEPHETKTADGVSLSKVKLPLSGIELEQGSYIFLFSLPNLAEENARFVVEELEFSFYRAKLL